MFSTVRDRTSLLVTLIFHGLLLLLIIFFGFSTPLPLPGEEGIQINFGNSEDGSGLIEPQGNQVQATAVSNPDEKQENLTQDFEEAPSIEKNNKHQNQEQIDNHQEDNHQQEQQVNQNALFPGSQNNSTGEGETGNDGNQGREDGSPNSDSHVGNGQGTKGVSYSLGGRNANALPKPSYTGNQQGKVVVEIFVDRNGNVTKATPGVKGSTTLNSTLLTAAQKAALNAKFDANPDAPEVQRGTITYNFMLQ